MKSDIHIMLVSAQAAANLLPALDPALKPKRAVLVVTEKMRARAEQLADVLRQTGVAPSLVALENEHDFAAIEATLLAVATEHEGQSIALNVTGGTKFMALAAQSVAAAAQWAVFYVDIDTDEVIWLGNKPVRHRLDQKLGLRNYLGGYGMSFVANPMPLATTEKQVDLLRNLLTRIGDFENALGSFNYLGTGCGAQSITRGFHGCKPARQPLVERVAFAVRGRWASQSFRCRHSIYFRGRPAICQRRLA